MNNHLKIAAVPRERDWLNPAERDRRRELEAVIERGIRTFIQSGKALVELRDARLYRDTHDTFEDYCREVWGFSDSRARQLVGAAATVTNVTVDGLPEPSSEGVARALTPLREEPDEQRIAWSEAVAQHGDKPTAAQVAARVRARMAARLVATAESAGIALEPPPDPGGDIRWSRVENAADSLRTLPRLGSVTWPTEYGDIVALDAAFAWLTDWLPKAKASWKAHKALMRATGAA